MSSRGHRTVFIVDDDQAVRDSLSFVLEAAGYEVRAFGSGRELLERIDEASAGCLLLDLRLAGMSGFDLKHQLADRGFRLPIIMITGHGDVDAAVQAFKCGMIDFLEKPFSNQMLMQRIEEAMQIDLTEREAAEQVSAIRVRYESLSPRERQVMEAVVEGKLNKQIAIDLGLSHKTIEVHRAHVMQKMSASSLADLVRMAVLLEDQKTA